MAANITAQTLDGQGRSQISCTDCPTSMVVDSVLAEACRAGMERWHSCDGSPVDREQQHAGSWLSARS